MRAIPKHLWLLAALSAVLQILPFSLAGPVAPWRRMFCWFCLIPLLWAMSGRDKNGNLLGAVQASALAYVCGVFWYLGNCYWIYQTMHTYGEIPKLASMGILLLFALYVALYHALFGALFGFLQQGLKPRTVLWSTPFLWVFVELARSRITGFPWDMLGYTTVDNVRLSHLAVCTGVMGLSFFVVLVNILLIMALRGISDKAYLRDAAIATVFVICLYGFSSLQFASPAEKTTASALLLEENLDVGAVTSAPIETKEDLLTSFSKLSEHPTFSSTTPSKPDIIAWPESPADFFDADPIFRHALHDLAIKLHTPLVVNDISYGAKLSSGRNEEYNSAAFFLPDGSYAGHYDKMRLVPFGEYVPYKPLFFFAGNLLGDLPFVPGRQRKLFSSGGHRYGVFICYESIFGDDIRRFVKDGAEVLVNISDDGWYGDSSAPWEHLDMVRMRAIENGRWIMRATNTGVTVMIDPAGSIRAEMPRHMRGSLQAGFSYRSGLTFYTRFGDWIGWLCAAVSAGFLLAASMSRSNKQGQIITREVGVQC
jgi:apolipoprotein N-acyltransferase